MTPEEPESRDFRRDEVIAGEYVLGVLSADDRRKVEARLVRDTTFATMVGRWQENLSNFDEAYEPLTPPPRVFASVERRLFPATETASSGIWNSLALWRGLTFTSLAALMALALVEVRMFQVPEGTSKPLVAEMSAEGSTINLVAQYDRESGRMRITPVAAGAVQSKSLELWLVEGEKPPVSLGVLPQTGEGEVVIAPDMRAKMADGAVFAVSIEAYGGSPTGQATGPIIAAGTARDL